MRTFLRWPSFALGVTLALTGCQSVPTAPLELTVLHINDHHAHLEGHSLDYPVADLPLLARAQDGAAPSRVRLEYGGFPRLATLFNEHRSDASHVLALHAGDAMTGTPYFNKFEGEADAALMNQICFDAFVLGNHEFDNGDAGLAHFLNFLNRGDCGTDILAANVVPGRDSPLQALPLKSYAVYEYDGQRVGVIGLDIAVKTQQSSNPDPGTRFLDETQTAQRYIDELTAQGIDRIILLTHYQYANDQALARQLSDVDVIVGGDSHSLLAAPSLQQLGLTPDGPYPTRTHNAEGDPVCIVQAWEYARAMGHLTVTFDGQGRVAQCEGRPLLPTNPIITFEYAPNEWRPLPAQDHDTVRTALASVPELRWTEADASTLEVLSPYREVVAELRGEHLGDTVETLCHARLPGVADCDGEGRLPLGSEIATVVTQSFLRAVPEADIALQNAGGVRTHLKRGPVNGAEVQRLLPFGNTLRTVNLTGAELITLLEQGITYALSPEGSTGGYPYAAGVRFKVDRSAPEGERLTRIEVNPQLAGQWRPLEPERQYRLVVNSYLAGGGDGYHLLADKSTHNTDIPYAQPLADWLKALKTENASLARPADETFSTQAFH